jgi:hypothetical protein
MINYYIEYHVQLILNSFSRNYQHAFDDTLATFGQGHAEAVPARKWGGSSMGLSFHTVGVGTNHDSAFLAALTSKMFCGNQGTYHYAPDAPATYVSE